MTNKKVGILGAGYIAEFHIRAIRAVKSVELIAICDNDFVKAEALQRQWGIPKVYGSLQEMVKDSEVEVIHILVPPDFHAMAALQCLENGKDIFVEKPFCCSTEEVHRVAETGRRLGRAIGVNHNNRFHPVFQKVEESIRGWHLGQLEHLIVCLNVPLRQLSAGQHSHWMFQGLGNIILEQAPHPLSQIVHLLGPLQKASVLPSGMTTLNSGHPFCSTWQCSLVCERGTAQLFLSFGRDYHDYWIYAIGQDATAFADLRRNTFQITRKTSLLEPLDNFLNGYWGAKQIMTSSLAQFFGYVLGFLKLRPASDPFSTGIRNSVSQFYADLAAGRSPSEGIERAIAVIEACDAIINESKKYTGLGSQAQQQI